MRAILFCLSLALLPACPLPAAAGPATLDISNDSHEEILNIEFRKAGENFFLRLDLPPLGTDTAENPGGVYDLRVDTGLRLWNFRDVPLSGAKKLIFCGRHDACLNVVSGREDLHFSARTENLVPPQGSTPLCELDRFHPGMKMGQVCELIPQNAPRDDNGAVLAGLAFAGLPWAARLLPENSGHGRPDGAQRLEHLELRRPYSAADLRKLLNFLHARGYSPWEAELPGLDINFDELSGDAQKKREALKSALDAFLARNEGQADIMFAPAASLAALATEEEPSGDAQLFTITLKPAANIMLVDVAAYGGKS